MLNGLLIGHDLALITAAGSTLKDLLYSLLECPLNNLVALL